MNPVARAPGSTDATSRIGSNRPPVPAPTVVSPQLKVSYLPVLDVAHGVAAGYQAEIHHAGMADADVHGLSLLEADLDGTMSVDVVTAALSMSKNLPVNTFVAIPVAVAVATSAAVRTALTEHGNLRGIILDIVGFSGLTPVGELEEALSQYRAAGASIAVGGHGVAQPELTSIVRLKPAILRLGRDWVRNIDTSDAKRSAVEIIGRLAGQLDAWILVEGVSTSAELRALASLEVPLAQGPFIGAASAGWPDIDLGATTALPKTTGPDDGALRSLLQQAYTTTNAEAAAAVLPETSGFDVVVVLDEYQRPITLFEQDGVSGWITSPILAVNISTPIADAVSRSISRPRPTRFSPLACTDAAGRFLGLVRIERLMTHLADQDAADS